MNQGIMIIETARPTSEPRFGSFPCSGCGRPLVAAEHTIVSCLRCNAEHLVREVDEAVRPWPRPAGSSTPVGVVAGCIRDLTDGEIMRGFMLGEWPERLT